MEKPKKGPPASGFAGEALHDFQNMIELLQIQLFCLPDKFPEPVGIGVSFIEKFLGRHAEILTDIKKRLHGWERLLVFNSVDVIVRLSQRQ